MAPTRKIKWKVQPRKGGGFFGTIVLPVGLATVPVTAPGTTQRAAIKNAAGLAEKMLSNPLVKAALPPGSGAAIAAVKLIGKYAGKGMLKKGMKLLKGKGARRIGKALKKLKFW